jgi:hypothetical protein
MQIRIQAATRNQIVNMGMVNQITRPSMQYAHQTNLAAYETWIASQDLSGLSRSSEERVVTEAPAEIEAIPELVPAGIWDSGDCGNWKEHGLSKLVKRENSMVAAGKQVHAKPNTPIFPDRFDICRNVVFLDTRTIMESSGEPVSKYRVKVLVPGRPEYILFSGAPTYLGHRSLFFDQ